MNDLTITETNTQIIKLNLMPSDVVERNNLNNKENKKFGINLIKSLNKGKEIPIKYFLNGMKKTIYNGKYSLPILLIDFYKNSPFSILNSIHKMIWDYLLKSNSFPTQFEDEAYNKYFETRPDILYALYYKDYITKIKFNEKLEESLNNNTYNFDEPFLLFYQTINGINLILNNLYKESFMKKITTKNIGKLTKDDLFYKCAIKYNPDKIKFDFYYVSNMEAFKGFINNIIFEIITHKEKKELSSSLILSTQDGNPLVMDYSNIGKIDCWHIQTGIHHIITDINELIKNTINSYSVKEYDLYRLLENPLIYNEIISDATIKLNSHSFNYFILKFINKSKLSFFNFVKKIIYKKFTIVKSKNTTIIMKVIKPIPSYYNVAFSILKIMDLTDGHFGGIRKNRFCGEFKFNLNLKNELIFEKLDLDDPNTTLKESYTILILDLQEKYGFSLYKIKDIDEVFNRIYDSIHYSRRNIDQTTGATPNEYNLLYDDDYFPQYRMW